MSARVKRREFITLLGSAAAAWPLAAQAQPSPIPMIGFLNSSSFDQTERLVRAFHKGLNETGYVEGRNVSIEYRWAYGQNDRLPGLAAELVRRQVTVIAATGSAVLAAKAATATIPVVFDFGANPVELGLVASLNKPGGNVTGITSLGLELGPKRLELLHELTPTADNIALLVNPTGPNAVANENSMRAAAHALGLQLQILNATTEGDLDAVFANSRVNGLVIDPEPFFSNRLEQLAALALRHALPVIYQYREFATAGGLMSYGSSVTDNWRLLGVYTGRVLKGEKPAELPVQQSTKIELIINLRTAKALGLTVPPALLARADEVIE